MIRRAVGFCKELGKEIAERNIVTFAASTVFFLFLSLIPILLLASLLVPFTGLDMEELVKIIDRISPEFVHGLLEQIVREAYSRSTGLLPMTALMVLWSSANGMGALIRGLQAAYGVEKRQNYLVFRLKAMGYTLVAVLFVIAVMFFMVFGRMVRSFLEARWNRLGTLFRLLIHGRYLLSVGFLLIFFELLYAFASGASHRLTVHLAGAAAASVGCALFTALFSAYLGRINSYSQVYGSLATFIVLLFWLYWCVCILLAGGCLNHSLEKKGES